MTKYKTYIPTLVIIGCILGLPLITDSKYILNLAILSGFGVMLAVTNHMVLRTGIWFMGHIAFYAIGAFTLIGLRLFLDFHFLPSLIMGGIAAGLSAFCFGYATSRVKGLPFCIISISLVEVVGQTIKKMVGGRSVICPSPDPMLGLDFTNRTHFYFLLLALVAVIIFIMHRLDRSVVGANLKIIAENEDLAESLGINTVRYRVMIITVCCALAGLAGGLFVSYTKVVGYTSFGFVPSAMIIMGIVFGGQYSFWGAVIGPISLLLLPEILSIEKANYQYIVYALVVLGAFFLLPKGLVSLPEVIRQMLPTKVKNGKNR